MSCPCRGWLLLPPLLGAAPAAVGHGPLALAPPPPLSPSLSSLSWRYLDTTDPPVVFVWGGGVVDQSRHGPRAPINKATSQGTPPSCFRAWGFVAARGGVSITRQMPPPRIALPHGVVEPSQRHPHRTRNHLAGIGPRASTPTNNRTPSDRSTANPIESPIESTRIRLDGGGRACPPCCRACIGSSQRSRPPPGRGFVDERWREDSS